MASLHTLQLCAAAAFAVAAAQSNASVAVDWTSVLWSLITQPTYQIVVNPLITRASPVHDQVYENIAAMCTNASNLGPIRFVPWLPYPRLSVAELEPPSGSALCGFRSTDDGSVPLELSCEGYGTISSIDFASYGTPHGQCGNLTAGSCDSANSVDAVKAACLGNVACTIISDNDFFGGDPCVNVSKSLSVQVSCSEAGNHSYWNFTALDATMADFMAATGNYPNGSKGADVIINFSTPPQWLYVTPDRVPYPDDPLGETWTYENGKTLVDPTAATFGQYFGRLLAWYTDGGFTDEYGQVHTSGYAYNISHWEALNEINDEHRNSPQQYTLVYDAMVQHMQALAPRGTKNIKWVGLALQGEGGFDYFTYFMNASNHAPGVPIDYVSFHFYADARRPRRSHLVLELFHGRRHVRDRRCASDCHPRRAQPVREAGRGRVWCHLARGQEPVRAAVSADLLERRGGYVRVPVRKAVSSRIGRAG